MTMNIREKKGAMMMMSRDKIEDKLEELIQQADSMSF